MRLIVESQSIEINLKPAVCSVNPVFELNQAPKDLASVTIDGKPLSTGAYAWDGTTLWMKAIIGREGARIRIHFQ